MADLTELNAEQLAKEVRDGVSGRGVLTTEAGKEAMAALSELVRRAAALEAAEKVARHQAQEIDDFGRDLQAAEKERDELRIEYQTAMGKALEDVEAAEVRVKELEAALWDRDGRCVICRRLARHAPDCARAALARDTETPT